MLVAASVVFLYYTVWTILMVSPFVLSVPSPFSHSSHSLPPRLLHLKTTLINATLPFSL